MAAQIETTRQRSERGMTTAEYAVGTLATVSIVGVLMKVIMTPEFQELMRVLIQWIFEQISHMLGF